MKGSNGVKNIIILGSTGSIGESALDVVRKNSDKLKICGLSTKKNTELLRRQIDEFKPSMVSVWDEKKAQELKNKIGSGIKVLSGMEGLIELARMDADLIVSALVGGIGLSPALEAIQSGKNIALANKEVLVIAGQLLQSEAKKHGVSIIPIDSEHSALMQCLWKRESHEIKKLILTASGGPFYRTSETDLKKITPEAALIHPTWKMGPKVTIDSATLMNKGFEVIEASWLFNIPIEKIDVVVHPESIIHGMVEFIDGSVSAFMHVTDMRVPIQYALSFPERWQNDYGTLDMAKIGVLHFEEPDKKRFPALELACAAGRIGGTMPAVLSAADEVCVEMFLAGKISFTDIPKIIKSIMDQHKFVKNPNLEDILSADKWAREKIMVSSKPGLSSAAKGV